MCRGGKNIDVYDRKSIGCFKQTVGKNMNVKGASHEGSEGTEAETSSDFLTLNLWEKKFLLLMPPSLWCFVIAALADKYNQ